MTPPGYKQTEVGVIPEEWEVKAVGELAQIKTGPFGTLLKASEYSGSEGVPLISVGEVGAGKFKISEHTPLVPPAVIRRLPQYLLRTGDVVFGRKGAVERSALVTENENGWFLGSDGISVRPQRECHSPYLACQFQRFEVQSWLLQNATGTTMASLNQAILSRVQIPYAPLPEQRAIATALSDVDALLAALDRLIAKQRDLKQAAMQQLLTGQTRLPGFEGCSTFKQTEVGLIPEDWRVESVGVISTVGRGRVISHREIALAAAPLYPVYSSQTSDNGIMGYLDTFQFDGEYITWTTDGANAGTVFHRNGRFNCTNVCGTIKLKTDYAGFVSRVLAGITPPHVSRNLGNPKLMNDVMKRISIPLPPLPEQTAIATVLSDMDGELAALEQRRDKTRALKQGMMQELLTGRTRLVASPQKGGGA